MPFLYVAFILCLLQVNTVSASEEAWVVDRDRAAYSTFRYEASEGTWISLDVSPDGRTIIFDLLGQLYRVPIVGGDATALTQGRSWNQFPRFSPDGRKLAFTSDRTGSEDLWVMDLSDGTLKNVSQMELPVFQGTWSRDGLHLFGTALNLRVRFPAYRFNFLGGRQELIPAGDRTPANHFVHRPNENALYFEHNDALLPASGPRVKRYDLETGEVRVYIERPGGAANPRLSPDGNRLAYVHRADKKTVLVVRNMETHRDKVVFEELDLGRFESRSFYGCYSNMAWHPNGQKILISVKGGISAIDIESGSTRDIPFRARVERKIDKTIRFKTEIPEGKIRTRSHRWAQRVPDGVLFEALGDIYLKTGDQIQNLTNSETHETNPVYDSDSGRLFLANWSDDEMGSLDVIDRAKKERSTLVSKPSQYGSLALSPSGQQFAFVRGAGGLMSGQHLEGQTEFELGIFDEHRAERVLTPVRWSANSYAKRPPTVQFSADEKWLFFTEFDEDVLTLKRIHLDGRGKQLLYRFPHATRAVISPDFKWIAYREYHRSFVSPYDHAGKAVKLSAADELGVSRRVDSEDGDFMGWDEDSQGLHWTRGAFFYEKGLEEILSGNKGVRKTDLTVEFELSAPWSSLVLRGVRVLSMNAELEVFEDTDILVEGNRIKDIGRNLRIPQGAKIFDLEGHTVMPGMFDAHGHYGSPMSPLNVIEQRLYGLHANLAYGVTTMFDVYGTTQKDFWVSDMLRAGKMTGARLYSVGDPIFVTKYRTKMHRPIENLEAALEHVQFNKDHGADAVKDYSNHTRAARQQLAEACRRLGVNLVAESFSNPFMNLTQLIDGFTGIEHTMGLTPLYDDYVQFFAATESGMTPTLVVVYNGPSGERYFHQNERLWEDPKLLRFFRPDELIRFRRPTHHWDDDFYHKEMAAELTKLHRAGVLLQMGAHGQMMGLGAHWEMELFVHGGFTPSEAIQIATINGFRHHGLDHSLGSIEPGKLADLVILEENPLEDIRNTRSIRYVIQNGVVYEGSDAARAHSDPKPARRLYFMNH